MVVRFSEAISVPSLPASNTEQRESTSNRRGCAACMWVLRHLRGGVQTVRQLFKQNEDS